MKLVPTKTATYQTCRVDRISAGQPFVPANGYDDVSRCIRTRCLLLRIQPLHPTHVPSGMVLACNLYTGATGLYPSDMVVTKVDASVAYSPLTASEDDEEDLDDDDEEDDDLDEEDEEDEEDDDLDEEDEEDEEEE